MKRMMIGVGMVCALAGQASLGQTKPGAPVTEKLIDVALVGVKRSEAVAEIAKQMEVEAKLDWEELEKWGIGREQVTMLTAKQIPAGRAMTMVLGPHGRNYWEIDGRKLLVRDVGELGNIPVERRYDLEGLLPPQFEKATPQYLASVLMGVWPETWTQQGGKVGTITTTAGEMRVTTMPRIQREVELFLAEMRGALGHREKAANAVEEKTKEILKGAIVLKGGKMSRQEALETVRKEAGLNLCVDWESLTAEGIDAKEEVAMDKRENVGEVLKALALPTGDTAKVMLCTDGVGTAVLTTPSAHSVMTGKRVGCYDVRGLVRSEEEAALLAQRIMERVMPGEWRDLGGTESSLRMYGPVMVVEGCTHTQDAVAAGLKGIRRTDGK